MRVLNVYEDVLVETARCFVENNSTVRRVAKELKVSKSTVHKRLRDFISTTHVNQEEKKLAKEVEMLISKNIQERHIRGGKKTRERFLLMKEVEK